MQQKFILCDVRSRFDGKKYIFNPKHNKDKCLCGCKKPLIQELFKRNCISNSSKYVCECE